MFSEVRYFVTEKQGTILLYLNIHKLFYFGTNIYKSFFLVTVHLSEGVLLYLENFHFCQAGNQPHIHDGYQQSGSS